MTKDRLYPALCAALVALCVFATVPWLEMGFNDDWSYAHTARALAASGRMTYDGWGQPMLGFQAFWGAALIRLFGFSFTLLRLSTLPFAAACAALAYGLGREAGLEAEWALAGAAGFALSPLFIPLAASYMTDIPSLCCWLACAWFGLRALREERASRTILWMSAAALTGFLGGTIRQVVWAVPLWTLAVAGWRKRKQPVVAAAAGLLWLAVAASAALCLRWFVKQPGAELGLYAWANYTFIDYARDTLESILLIAAGSLVFVLPVLALFLMEWRQLLRRPRALIVSALIASAAIAGLIWGYSDDVLPGNMVTHNGILYAGQEALGSKPEYLPDAALYSLAAAVAVCAAFAGAAAARSAGAWIRGRRTADAAPRSAGRLCGFLILYIPPCLVYVAVTLCRGYLFDRYLLPLLPAVAIPLLRIRPGAVRDSVPKAMWAVVALLAVYGTSTMHDYLASERARLEAATRLSNAGIARNQISAGFEYDAWTELERTGRIEDRQFPDKDEPGFADLATLYPVFPPFWFWAHAPSIAPVYLVTYSRVGQLHDLERFPPIGYTAWLPPFHREVFTQASRLSVDSQR